MKKTVLNIVKQLSQQLGDQLEAVFLYGSLSQGFYQPYESDVNLFIVVAEGTNVRELQPVFAPIWAEHGDFLKRAPNIATRHAFERHLQLNTLLAAHFVRDGEKLYGAKPLLKNDLRPLNPAEAYAHIAHQAMLASQALIPEILEPEMAAAAQRTLHSLVRRIQQAPIKSGETNAQLFARVQHYLLPIISKLPEIKSWPGLEISPQTSPFLPGLSAIYEEMGKLVLAFSNLYPQQLLRIDWNRVSQEVPDSALGVEITSATQLYLIATYQHPLHIMFRKYEHSWGPDFLAKLEPSQYQVLRQAARLASKILVETLPNAILTGQESDLPEIIHDFQNKLLNVQLEHELMVRFQLVERFTPPEPLPDRETDVRLRIDAIFQNLEWWADFYASLILDES